MEAALQPGQAAQCVGVQTSDAPDMVTGKARSGLRYMWATAVSVIPSSGKRSNLRRGIVRGGRSIPTFNLILNSEYEMAVPFGAAIFFVSRFLQTNLNLDDEINSVRWACPKVRITIVFARPGSGAAW